MVAVVAAPVGHFLTDDRDFKGGAGDGRGVHTGPPFPAALNNPGFGKLSEGPVHRGAGAAIFNSKVRFDRNNRTRRPFP
ncbi:hypothetical protein GCM10007924_06840 [Sneathiella chinensis]|uniref:Uncharacterized protein n=1 Tax=Sneathiella chinensis TaxID=349750 RepID=A0ABQ5U2H9_9PROT|nr:hypothetical protein GCM10007924_06840 [Sneathiella chinensis]